jgi:hypothetical protein
MQSLAQELCVKALGRGGQGWTALVAVVAHLLENPHKDLGRRPPNRRRKGGETEKRVQPPVAYTVSRAGR